MYHVYPSPQIKNSLQRGSVACSCDQINLRAPEAVAGFFPGARGARIVPQDPAGSQILSGIYRAAKPTSNLTHWLRVEASEHFCASGLILPKSAIDLWSDLAPTYRS
ncbi:hypothetical protein AVEN_9172-1 [Araneus ventricosus]|uniref:Uncharacterized protein n=1 Tax=Araneus ventricosus TaxID=182803 RepID=A0A4Y2NBA6_ARAVE|nr:hypothetical protein AVEN_9172-1 [Araneus ventricosus]